MLVGLVGKPSAGKSTFFKAMTSAQVDIASYPFTTIKPNRGAGYVKVDCVDKEFNTKCNPREGFCVEGKRFVPVELLDVAGLVPGAHEGKGMGNQFLDDLRQADVLIHVVDASGSTDDQGRPVDAGSHNPAADIRFLETELDMWYYNVLQKSWERMARQTHMEHLKIEDSIAKQMSAFGATPENIKPIILKLQLNKENPTTWTDDEVRKFCVELRKVTKPILIAANKADMLTAPANIERLQKEFPDYLIVPCSAESELALKEAAKEKLIDYIPGEGDFTIAAADKLTDKQQKALDFIKVNMLQKHGSTGVQECLNKAVFSMLGYIAIFPGGANKLEDAKGNRLPDCFLLKPDSTALDFAFYLHTDLGNGFIRAIDVKTKKTVGKEHPLKHRDVIEIISRA